MPRVAVPLLEAPVVPAVADGPACLGASASGAAGALCQGKMGCKRKGRRSDEG
jgi:hypothetical protein